MFWNSDSYEKELNGEEFLRSKQQILSARHNLQSLLNFTVYIHVQASVMNIYITIFRLMALKSVKQLHLTWEAHVFCLGFVSLTSVLLVFFLFFC